MLLAIFCASAIAEWNRVRIVALLKTAAEIGQEHRFGTSRKARSLSTRSERYGRKEKQGKGFQIN